MSREFKFKKSRILFGLLFCGLMLFVSLSFLVNPGIFIRNVFVKEIYILTIGAIGLVYFFVLLNSFLIILLRKYAILITDEFLIDNSKYESIGKIKWDNISKIKKLKKNNIQVFLNMGDLTAESNNLLKKFLRYMQNWNSEKSILISSALLECNIDELFENISVSYEANKRKKNHT